MDHSLSDEYWEKRWQKGETGWDIQSPSPAIIDLVIQETDLSSKILFPGAGSGYEAAYLFNEKGYKNIFICDWAETPLKRFAKAYPDFPKDQIIHGDFFAHIGSYDFIIEQTFFCAIHPEWRKKYRNKTLELLQPNGILMGLFFDRTFNKNGPPFGGTAQEYERLFKKYFKIKKLESSTLSIKPRLGSELEFIFQKR